MEGDLATVGDVKAMLGSIVTPLTVAASASDTTLTVLSTKDFQNAGVVVVEDESIAYAGKTDTTFTGCTRGYLGTQATAHAVEARVAKYADEQLIRSLISSASEWVRQRTGDPFIEETFVRQLYSGMGGTVLVPKRRPIGVVTELRIDGDDIPRSTGALVPGWVNDASAIYLRGFYRFHRGVTNVELSYSGGYCADAIPADIREVVADAVVQTLRDRERGGVSSKTLATETISYFDRAATKRSLEVLAQRREVVPAA